MKLLDAFCGAGGATRGYQQAGFHVTGVDIKPQRHYCGDAFVLGDAIEYITKYGHTFDFIHASPPCQAYSLTKNFYLGGQPSTYPDLVEPVREALKATGRPYVIENVHGSPLIKPVLLCGPMFDLATYRERLFECGNGFTFTTPPHLYHSWPIAKMGRPPKDGEFMHIVGHFSGMARAREIMQIDWMNRDELRESIPPAYTKYIGKQVIEKLREK